MKKSLFSVVIASVILNANVYANTTTSTNAAEVKASKTLPPKPPAPTVNKTAESTKKKTSTSSANKTSNATSTTNTANANQTVVLQMGAFTDPSLAYKQAAKVSLLGVPARVVPMKNSNGDIVRVVRSSSRLKQVDAEKTAADLREQQVNVLLMH